MGREPQVRTTASEPSPTSTNAWHWAHCLNRFDAVFGVGIYGLNVT